MSPIVVFVIGFIVGLLIGIVLSEFVYEKRQHYKCNGSIVMHGDELYLCLTHEDKKAFESCRYATIRLEREKFRGFNET
jgi:hypothetical protein